MSLSSVAFAKESGSYNYVYVDSIDEVDFSTLSPNDIVVMPIDESKEDDDDTVINELTESPDYLLQTRGSSSPNLTSVWNIVNKGQYDFAGSASSWATSDLYTNYFFTGKDNYSIIVTNNSSNDVTVSFHGWILTYRTVTIQANTTNLLNFSSSTANYTVSASTDWYIRFSAPCDVEGYVK